MTAQVYWFTGLSGAGKTTLAEGVRTDLEDEGIRVVILDGDDVRRDLHRHLGFSSADIQENNALIAGLCQERRDAYDVVLVPIISPFIKCREKARRRLGDGFFEIYCKADVSVVTARDVKGLYAKAQAGEITNMIGVSPDAPYEPPPRADLTLDTELEAPESSVARLALFIRQNLTEGGSAASAPAPAPR